MLPRVFLRYGPQPQHLCTPIAGACQRRYHIVLVEPGGQLFISQGEWSFHEPVDRKPPVLRRDVGVEMPDGVVLLGDLYRPAGDDRPLPAVLKERGNHPGLVWVFSALEPCTTYQPWHDKHSGRTYLRYDDGKCLHYYFYFIDEDLGLCYVRVPTWCTATPGTRTSRVTSRS